MECWCGRTPPPGRRAHSDWYHTRLREQLTQRLAASGLELPGPPPADELPDHRFIVAALLLLDPPATGRVARWRAAQVAQFDEGV